MSEDRAEYHAGPPKPHAGPLNFQRSDIGAITTDCYRGLLQEATRVIPLCQDWEYLHRRVEELEEERDEARQWVRDLHSGMYVNCVYCGHRYGPKDEVPESMADILKAHVEQCPAHPMSALKKRVEELESVVLVERGRVAMWKAKSEEGWARAALLAGMVVRDIEKDAPALAINPTKAEEWFEEQREKQFRPGGIFRKPREEDTSGFPE